MWSGYLSNKIEVLYKAARLNGSTSYTFNMTSIVSFVLLAFVLVLGILLMENTSNALARNRYSRFKESWSRTDVPSIRRSKPLAKNLTRVPDVDGGSVHVQCRSFGKACTDDDQCCSNICLHFSRCSQTAAVSDYT